jgi:hypothetical protein
MIWLTLLRRYALPLGVLVVIGTAYAYHRVELNKAHRAGYAAATAEMAARVAKANAETEALEQRQRIQSQRAAQAWESKRNELQGQVDTLLARGVSVRLCKPAAARAVSVPGATRTATSADDSAGRDVGAVQAGSNIGTQLVQLGAECERYRQQLSELQSWVSQALAR